MLKKIKKLFTKKIVNRKEFEAFFHTILKPLRYKKNKNNWTKETKEIEKYINLQKSQYGNSYYLNYGFKIKDNTISSNKYHWWTRVWTGDRDTQRQLSELLNLEMKIKIEERKIKLQYYLETYVIKNLEAINTKNDLKVFLEKEKPNNVPLSTKKYLGIVD